MVNNWSVTFAMALTTTTGFCARRPLTIAAARSMALASCTEVPPNFITIIGGRTSTEGSRDQLNKRYCMDTSGFSPEVSPHFEQLSVQQGGARRAANRVMGKHGEHPVQDTARPQTADR